MSTLQRQALQASARGFARAASERFRYSLAEQAARRNELRVEREDIWFWCSEPGRLTVAVRVHNGGQERSEPTAMQLQTAEFGAFVPWQPLTTVQVPEIEPGDSRELRVQVPAPPSAWPPTVEASQQRQPDRSRRVPWWRFARKLVALLPWARSGRHETAAIERGADVVRESLPLHWAGNINVLVGNRSTERHLSGPLHIEPGHLNMAVFVLGTHRDAYRFDLSGPATGWGAALSRTAASAVGLTWATVMAQMPRGIAATLLDSVNKLPLGRWIEFPGRELIWLSVAPPVRCKKGWLKVHVEQRSSGREAVVEFSLDPRARAAGCYVL